MKRPPAMSVKQRRPAVRREMPCECEACITQRFAFIHQFYKENRSLIAALPRANAPSTIRVQ